LFHVDVTDINNVKLFTDSRGSPDAIENLSVRPFITIRYFMYDLTYVRNIFFQRLIAHSSFLRLQSALQNSDGIALTRP